MKLAKNNEYNGESSVSPSSVTFYINNDDSEVADKMNSVTYDVAFLSSSQFSSIENKKGFEFGCGSKRNLFLYIQSK